MPYMFPQGFNSGFRLTPEEQDGLVTVCEEIANNVLGPADEEATQDIRDRLMRDGSYAKIARMAIEDAGDVVGHELEFELFASEGITNQSEARTIYRGLSYKLNVDLCIRELSHELGFGTMAVDADGDYDVDIENSVTLTGKDKTLVGVLKEMQDEFSPREIDSSDQLYVYDIRDILAK